MCPTDVPALGAGLHDPEPLVRQRAARALVPISTEAAPQALLGAVEGGRTPR